MNTRIVPQTPGDFFYTALSIAADIKQRATEEELRRIRAYGEALSENQHISAQVEAQFIAAFHNTLPPHYHRAYMRLTDHQKTALENLVAREIYKPMRATHPRRQVVNHD